MSSAKEKVSFIQSELESRFLTYALSTIVSRSLPDVRDGLKPIHRRILFAMDQMGVSFAAKYVKSAKIIGEVLGKYHPHGDASTYESMVRMAQDFSMRYPLVDGKGNFGSLDGDPPAAYRYTEGKLTPITSYLLRDLKKQTVDFRSTYDNTLKEPVVLPAQLPNLLINGASGIAVGMACSFPSHNIGEVISALIALIDNPDLPLAKMMKSLKGPDFPTGGIILTSKADIQKAYETGSGAVKMRGEWKLEDLPRSKQQIILTSIPYGVNKAKMIERIAEIIIAKKVTALQDVRDESDEKIRVVLEIKANSDAEKVMAYIFKHTDFECNFQMNFTCLKPNGEPDRLSLMQICRYFLDFRNEVVTRRLNYELSLLEKRLHILAAFVIIFNNLDKALKLIRSSKSREEAHEKLKKAFKLDDEQTAGILEIPLYRLVGLEIDKLLAEQKEKLKEKNRIQSILKSSKKIWKVVRDELSEISEKFKDKRKTSLKAIEIIDYNPEDFIEHEDVFLVLSKNGWLRKLKSLGDGKNLKFKENDELLIILKCNTRDLVAFFTSFGIVYVQKSYNLPFTRGGFGEPIQSLFKFGDGEKVIHLLSLESEEKNDSENDTNKNESPALQTSFEFEETNRDIEAHLMVASTSGFGFKFPITNLSETTRTGRKIMSLKNEDRMVGISLADKDHIFFASANGKGLVIAENQISVLTGTGMGSRLMKLPDTTLVGFKFVSLKERVTLVHDDNREKLLSISKLPVYNRGSMGVIISKRKKLTRIK
jgi:DNA gyrase subunit A